MKNQHEQQQKEEAKAAAERIRGGFVRDPIRVSAAEEDRRLRFFFSQLDVLEFLAKEGRKDVEELCTGESFFPYEADLVMIDAIKNQLGAFSKDAKYDWIIENFEFLTDLARDNKKPQEVSDCITIINLARMERGGLV